MYLIEKFQSPSPFRSLGKRSVSNNFDLISRSFDENVLRRLKSLTASSNTLSWLAMAVDFLSSTHLEAGKLISNLRSSEQQPDKDKSLELYMDHSVKLLDLCNSISSEIDLLRQRRLRIRFVLQLLKPAISQEEKLRKARDSLTDWVNNSNLQGSGKGVRPEVLIGDLASALGSAPCGKITSARNLIRRTIYAVGLVTVFVGGVLASFLYGVPDVAKVRVPGEFLWADSFNELQSAIFEGKKLSVQDFDEVATRAVRVREIVDKVVSGGDHKDLLSSAVKELGTATESFSDGLERLSDGVNGMFNTVLTTRNGVLDNFRVCQDQRQRK